MGTGSSKVADNPNLNNSVKLRQNSITDSKKELCDQIKKIKKLDGSFSFFNTIKYTNIINNLEPYQVTQICSLNDSNINNLLLLLPKMITKQDTIDKQKSILMGLVNNELMKNKLLEKPIPQKSTQVYVDQSNTPEQELQQPNVLTPQNNQLQLRIQNIKNKLTPNQQSPFIEYLSKLPNDKVRLQTIEQSEQELKQQELKQQQLEQQQPEQQQQLDKDDYINDICKGCENKTKDNLDIIFKKLVGSQYQNSVNIINSITDHEIQTKFINELSTSENPYDILTKLDKIIKEKSYDLVNDEIRKLPYSEYYITTYINSEYKNLYKLKSTGWFYGGKTRKQKRRKGGATKRRRGGATKRRRVATKRRRR